ncbi:pyridoxal-phosphate dependent enzyme [Solimonas sp. C16B3]|uniref:Pyridoxal-phosphate dependent enzyme n=1 Tax=Solimonas marina TaxID=2714601 RepID=A0A969W877_9GAMM|nr:pyridoxal-phosphate dependent enzyme [Solimonas marina]
MPVCGDDVLAAAARIQPYVHRTPVLHSQRLDALLGVRAAFKCENFQRIGAFKARGAHNAVFSLSSEAAQRGVVTHSSGNHAAALCLAARHRGIAAHIVMPDNAPRAKVESVRRLGGHIQFCAPTLAAREAGAAAIVRDSGATLIHPYDDPRIIAGQGTAALELLDDAPELDAILAPVGGGGLMAGTAIAARHLKPDIRIVATEPAQADDAFRSWRSGARVTDAVPNTIADGLRTMLGAHNFTILRALLDDFVTVSEAGIVQAMRLVWEILKIVIEPSSAVPVAALLEHRERLGLAGQRVGIIVTGGNVDLDHLPWQP